MSRRDDIAERVRQLWQTHETITLFEDGLYRHYRVNLPEAWSWVEIITTCRMEQCESFAVRET